MSSPQQIRTETRTEIRREDDGELLGFVSAADGRPDGSAVALAVFGGEIGVHPDHGSAEHQIREVGLSSLAERWWIDVGKGWEQCWLIEASPERLVAVIAAQPFLGSAQLIPPGTPLRLTPPAEF